MTKMPLMQRAFAISFQVRLRLRDISSNGMRSRLTTCSTFHTFCKEERWQLIACQRMKFYKRIPEFPTLLLILTDCLLSRWNVFLPNEDFSRIRMLLSAEECISTMKMLSELISHETSLKTGGRSVFSRMTNTIIWLPALSRGFLL